jgi:hypothetical protein
MSAVETIAFEEWRSIPGFADYEVSSHGGVRSIDRFHFRIHWKTGKPVKIRMRGKTIKPSTYLNKGSPVCLAVHLRANGQTHSKRVHRLVLMAFVGPPPVGTEGCHNDGNCKNNKVANLRWDTHTANLADAKAHGTLIGRPHVRGVGSPRAKFTEQDVLAIRAVPKYLGISRDLADAYNVTPSAIKCIRSGANWKHLL